MLKYNDLHYCFEADIFILIKFATKQEVVTKWKRHQNEAQK